MKWDVRKISLIATVLSLLTVCSGHLSHAQQADVSLEVELNESLLSSQNIDLQSIIIQDGRGFELYRLFISNDNVSEEVTDLYLSIDFGSEKMGLIFSRSQIELQSFSLRPGQKVFVTSNTIMDGLPGIEEEIYFEGTFTPEGRKFFNELKGLSILPRDRYTLEFSLYHGNSRQNGGSLIATSSADLGIGIDETRNFYLIYPGDVLGYEAEISNRYPNFIWQGGTDLAYRLIVVEAREGESAESLLGGAISSEPVRISGSAGPGSLLEHEMLDVVLDRGDYQYPSSGVQRLETGKTYYWQVLSQLKTRDAAESVKSEIWSFTLTGRDGEEESSQLSGELTRVLKKILGERYDRLEEEGSGFRSVEVDGEVYREAEALRALLRLSDRIDGNEVSIVIQE